MNARVEELPVDFPLRGEWTAVQTPAFRVPSHGTHQLAQTYAFDFLRINWEHRGFRFHKRSALYYETLGVRLDECYGWSAPIHSPFNGIVVCAADGHPERQRVHFVRDLAVVLKNALMADLSHGDFRPFLGNYIILRAENSNVHALIAHAQCGSVLAREGESVQTRQKIAAVGHSGNSTAPHLHFHLMDGPDLRTAKGVPCCFKRYQAERAGHWVDVENGVPAKRERVRHDA